MKRMSIRKHGSGVIVMIVDASFTSGVLVLNKSQQHERGLYALIVVNNTRHATFFILLNLIYLACTAPSHSS